MDRTIFLVENQHIDFSSTIIQDKVNSLFHGVNDDIEKAKSHINMSEMKSPIRLMFHQTSSRRRHQMC